MIVPVDLDITIYQGADWDMPIAWIDVDGTAVDLTGCTAAMQIRPEASSGTLIAELTTENGFVVMNGSVAPIWLNMPYTATAALPSGRYVYDVEVSISSSVYRILQGRCFISAEVTR